MSNLTDFFGASGTIASIQRGSTAIGITAAGSNTAMANHSATATINSVDVAKSYVITSYENGTYSRNYSTYWGFSNSISAACVLTNATTLTFTTGKGHPSHVVAATPAGPVVKWEVVEYV